MRVAYRVSEKEAIKRGYIPAPTPPPAAPPKSIDPGGVTVWNQNRANKTSLFKYVMILIMGICIGLFLGFAFFCR